MLFCPVHPGWRASVWGALSLALLATVGGCARKAGSEPQPQAAAKPPPEVVVTEARLEVWPETIRVQGNLRGHEHATVGSKLAGRIGDVHIDLGSPVRRGDPLVTLETDDLKLRVQQAEAQLLQACAAIGLDPEDSESRLDRENSPPVVLERALLEEARANAVRGEQLLARGTMTAAEFEGLRAAHRAAEARYRSALNRVGESIALVGVRRAELALMKQQLADARIEAPFDGVVEQRLVADGEYVHVGQQVVSIVRTDPLRFAAGVPERAASRIHTGQSVRVLLDGLTEPLLAEVSRVSPSVSPTNRAVWIEVDVPNPQSRLQAGRFAEVEIEVNPNARALVVPASALREFAGIEKVWVVRDQEAQELPVRTGRRTDTLIEIVSGLAAGDLVVRQSDDGRAGPVVAIHSEPEVPQRLSKVGSIREPGLSE